MVEEEPDPPQPVVLVHVLLVVGIGAMVKQFELATSWSGPLKEGDAVVCFVSTQAAYRLVTPIPHEFEQVL